MLCYAITSRVLYPGGEQERQAALLQETAGWIAKGIDFIQLREKDLPGAALAELSRKILRQITLAGSRTRLLINSRPDVALATGAHGVHLSTSEGQLTPTQVRRLYASTGRQTPIISLACHTLAEVQQVRDEPDSTVDLILFSPVFEKSLGEEALPGHGLELLRSACIAGAPVPVYALGGVTFDNATACLEAGATGIAGIRLFRKP
jgi:thiamine-phosphate pyrophosphorylase